MAKSCGRGREKRKEKGIPGLVFIHEGDYCQFFLSLIYELFYLATINNLLNLLEILILLDNLIKRSITNLYLMVVFPK